MIRSITPISIHGLLWKVRLLSLRCAGSGNLSGFKRASRVHCLVQLRREKLWLFDTASTNGTVVQKANGSQVVVNADCPVHRLGFEDVVSIGGREVSLIF